RFIRFLDDNEFSSMRQVLDSKMKSLSKRGVGLKKSKRKLSVLNRRKLCGNVVFLASKALRNFWIRFCIALDSTSLSVLARSNEVYV
ncbi:hypothetical protein ScPMuIL_009388, partial [Solemya velum]